MLIFGNASELRKRRPLACKSMDRDTVIKHSLQRAVSDDVSASALMRNPAICHHHQVIGMQRE